MLEAIVKLERINRKIPVARVEVSLAQRPDEVFVVAVGAHTVLDAVVKRVFGLLTEGEQRSAHVCGVCEPLFRVLRQRAMDYVG